MTFKGGIKTLIKYTLQLTWRTKPKNLFLKPQTCVPTLCKVYSFYILRTCMLGQHGRSPTAGFND